MATFEVTQQNTIAQVKPGQGRHSNPHSQFSSESGLVALTLNWPNRRLVEIWNRLPGATPLSRFTSRPVAAHRIWRELQRERTLSTEVRPSVKPRSALVGSHNSETKAARILALVKRSRGATLPEIIAATGWQPHSIRGFISAQIRRRMGLIVRSFERNGMRVYQILPALHRPKPAQKRSSLAAKENR
jgi:hypothetical protein